MSIKVVLLCATVMVQFLLEVTLGRIFFAPSLIPFCLVFLYENYGNVWSIEGAFWSGLCLDLLLHQPPGSSSIAFLAGLYAADLAGRISAGAGRGYIVVMTVLAVLVSDSVFIVIASRPFGTGFGPVLLRIFPRAALSAAAAALILYLSAFFGRIRSSRFPGI